MNNEDLRTKSEEPQLVLEELEERIAPSQPPGLLGYEGQPGNQAGGGNPGGGTTGYEGQPGNQSN